MNTQKNLSAQEQQAINNLINTILATSDTNQALREEIFNRLSTFVEGVKLGLVAKQET